MSTKKYVSLSKLSTFLDNLKDKFASKTHTHTVSEISGMSDYTVDDELSTTSTNPVQNKVLNAEFDAISDGMNALEAAIDDKADAEHNHDSVYESKTDAQTKLDEAIEYTDTLAQNVEAFLGLMYGDDTPDEGADEGDVLTIREIANDEATTLLEEIPLVGSTENITPSQVAAAVAAGRPISITYTDATFGTVVGNHFTIADNGATVLAGNTVYYKGNYIAYVLVGNIGSGYWGSMFTTVAEQEKITDALANKADKSAIPTRLSQLTNDSNYVTYSALESALPEETLFAYTAAYTPIQVLEAVESGRNVVLIHLDEAYGILAFTGASLFMNSEYYACVFATDTMIGNNKCMSAQLVGDTGTDSWQLIVTEIAQKSDIDEIADTVSTHNHDDKYDTKGAASAVQTNLNTVSDILDEHTSDSNIHVTTTNKTNWNSAYTHSQSAHARTDATKVADSTTNGNILINGTETNVYSHPNSGVTAGAYKSVTVNAQGHVTSGTNPTTLAGYGITDAETKGAASSALASAKEYTDSVASGKADKTHNHDSSYDVKGAASSALASAKTYADSAATTAANTVKNDLLNGAGAAFDTLKELGDLIVDNQDAIDALETIASGKADASHTHAISDVSGLQSALDGKAAASHGTHVSYSTTAPVMDGTASVGSASTVARSDHKHPTDTSRASKTDFDTHTSNTTVHITSTERSNWNAAKSHADSAHAPSNAEKNQNAFSNITVGSTTIAADSATDTLTLVAGTNVTITPDATNDKITISATDTNTTYSAGTGISLSGTTFSNSGVRSISTGSSNGTISVNTNGASAEVAVKGLGSAAYTASTAYDAAGAANTALTNAKTYTDTVAAGKANSSHGNHVPTTQTANNAIFLRNDNTWATVTPANIGAAPSSHSHTISNITNLQSSLDGKAAQTSLDSHTANTTVHITSTERSNWNAAKSHADSAHAPSNAQPNQNAFSNIAVSGQTTVAADTTTDTVTFAGSNVSITTDATNDKVTFSVADGTTSAKGVVQLTNSTSSTSTTTAATPSSVKSAYDRASTAITNASTAQTRADNAYTLAESKVDSLSDLGITATAAELNYVDGVTSNVQTQLDGKVPTSRTVNGKALSANITLSASDVGAVNSSNWGSNDIGKVLQIYADGTVGTTLLPDYVIAGKKSGTTLGSMATAEGNSTTSSGTASHAEGFETTASGNYSHAEGSHTTASKYASHAEGYQTTASGNYSHAEGQSTTASGDCSHAEGYQTTASGHYSHASGYQTTAGYIQCATGKNNEQKPEPTAPNTQDSTHTDAIFMIGCGTNKAKKNAFRVTSGGKCFGSAAFGASGADFAELFEWEDGNPNNEDRRGLFVTLEGEKIRLANADDAYIGVISGSQAFIGNSASEEWQGKYLTDVFGAKISQKVEVPAVIDEETGKVITPATTTTQYVVNPDYNPDEEYIMRENRKEWGIVGLLGQIVMIDDGTCVVGGYVQPSVNGIGTAANSGYRVMKRIDENHIKVLVK